MTRIDSVAFKRILNYLSEALQKKHNQKIKISLFFFLLMVTDIFHFLRAGVPQRMTIFVYVADFDSVVPEAKRKKIAR